MGLGRCRNPSIHLQKREDLSGVYIGPLSGGQGAGPPADMVPGPRHCGQLLEKSGRGGWAGCPHTVSFLWGKEDVKQPQVQLDQQDGGGSMRLAFSCSPALCPNQQERDPGCWGRVVCERDPQAERPRRQRGSPSLALETVPRPRRVRAQFLLFSK